MKQLTVTGFFLLLLSPAWGQMEGTLHYMNSLPQVVNNNPAFVPKYKIAAGVPFSTLFEGYTNSGFTYNDMIKKQDGQVKADLSGLLSKLPENTYITAEMGADLFRFGYKVNQKLYISTNITGRLYNRGLLPKDMVALFVEGNAPYVNSSIQVAPKIESQNFLEAGLGASYAVNKKLRVGAKLKFLRGATSVTTELSDFSIAVDSNYHIAASAALDLRTSGMESLTGSDYSLTDEVKNYMKNKGVSFDLGATYRLLDKLTLNASAIDIGGIKWRNDLYHYTLNKQTANYTFSGIEATALINGTSNDYIEAQKDSIQSKFELQESTGEAFKTPLPKKFFLGGSYELMNNLTVGTVFYAEQFRGRFSPGWTTSVNKNFGRVFSGTLSYTMTSRAYANFGAGLSLNLAPVQLYVVGDNLLKIPGSLIVNKDLNEYINTSQVINLRAGLNIVVGWDRSEQETLTPSKSKPVNQSPGKKTKVKQTNSKKEASYLKVRRKSKR